MSKQDESVFPTEQVVEWIEVAGDPRSRAPYRYGVTGGLTKRELFAAMALQSMFAPMLAEGSGEQRDLADMAIVCCKAADALLAELAKEQA